MQQIIFFRWLENIFQMVVQTNTKTNKKFKNLCIRRIYQDQKGEFVMKVQWTFFATCHGKSPCDGIGDISKKCHNRCNSLAPSFYWPHI